MPVSKKRVVVWTNISYTNAKASAESMISNDYVQTGLLTGKAWDTTCHWIEDYINTLPEESSLTNSIYYGNYNNSIFKYLNSSNEEVEKPESLSEKILAGSSEYTKTKNIYDLAGNVWEWTNEAYSSGSIRRGGSCDYYGDNYAFSYRYGSVPFDKHVSLGFRARLYIK